MSVCVWVNGSFTARGRSSYHQWCCYSAKRCVCVWSVPPPCLREWFQVGVLPNNISFLLAADTRHNNSGYSSGLYK